MPETDIHRALRPQSRLELVLVTDMAREVIDVRSTVIYDYQEPNRLIVAQTNPPVLKSQVGQPIEVSFVIRDWDTRELRRFGYETKLLALVNDYEFRDGQTEQALIIGYPVKGVQETSVRLHVRVRPSTRHGILVSLKGFPGQCHLIDLSVGGALVSLDRPPDSSMDLLVNLELTIGDQVIDIQAERVRLFDREGSRLTFVGFKFLDLKPEIVRLIQQTVSNIMREELRARSGLDDQ